jgi:hypothetical protein
MQSERRQPDLRPSRELLRILSLSAEEKKAAQEAAPNETSARPERTTRMPTRVRPAERQWM